MTVLTMTAQLGMIEEFEKMNKKIAANEKKINKIKENVGKRSIATLIGSPRPSDDDTDEEEE